jgi:hypothetical protein
LSRHRPALTIVGTPNGGSHHRNYPDLVATLWQLRHDGDVDLPATPATTPVADDTTGSAAAVAVETLLLGAHHGRLTYRVARRDLRDDEHPDTAARRLAGFTDRGPSDGAILHSTSWRFAAGQIVLTYAALPDPDPGSAAVLDPPAEPARGTDPLAPSPPQVEQADVAAHACRHLAFLHHTDPVVAACSHREPELWKLLDSYRPDVAGRLRPPPGLRSSPPRS